MSNKTIIQAVGNYDHAIPIFNELVRRWQNNDLPYTYMKKPQDEMFLPKDIKSNPLHHALFLFSSCFYMRGAIQSGLAIKKLTEMYDTQPGLFLPENFIGEKKAFTIESLNIILGEKLKFSLGDNLDAWITGMARLHNEFNGDPRTLFSSLNYDTCCSIIIKNRNSIGFKGFKEKMVSMLAYYLIDAELIPSFPFPPPIDFHLMRLMTQQGILTLKDCSTSKRGKKINLHKNSFRTDKLLKAARELTLKYILEQKVSSNDLANALWLYSSQVCSKSPHGSRVKKGEYAARSTPIEIKDEVKWSLNANNKFYNTCAICPIKNSCLGFISHAHYYANGEFQLIQTTKTDQLDLFVHVP